MRRPSLALLAVLLCASFAFSQQTFKVGDHVDAAPFGESMGFKPCVVASVNVSGGKLIGYSVQCEGGSSAFAVGANPHWIRPATLHGSAAPPKPQGATQTASSAQPARTTQPATPAKAAPQAAPATAGPLTLASVRGGSYYCATFSGGRLVGQPGLSPVITGPGTYKDSEGSRGTFTVSGDEVVFHGAGLDGTHAKYEIPKKGNPVFRMMIKGHYANVDCDLE